MTSDHVDIWVGLHVPKFQTVIVNTGSEIMAFLCRGYGSNCGGGYHTNAVFNDTKSDIFTRITDRDDCTLGTYRKGEGGYRVSMSYQGGACGEPMRPKIGSIRSSLTVRPSTPKRIITRTRENFPRIPSGPNLDVIPRSRDCS